MTNIESAVYNRISTKCHLFVKQYFPSEYKKLAAAAADEYTNRRSRRVSLAELQTILGAEVPAQKPAVSVPTHKAANSWGDIELSEG